MLPLAVRVQQDVPAPVRPGHAARAALGASRRPLRAATCVRARQCCYFPGNFPGNGPFGVIFGVGWEEKKVGWEVSFEFFLPDTFPILANWEKSGKRVP